MSTEPKTLHIECIPVTVNFFLKMIFFLNEELNIELCKYSIEFLNILLKNTSRVEKFSFLLKSMKKISKYLIQMKSGDLKTYLILILTNISKIINKFQD